MQLDRQNLDRTDSPLASGSACPLPWPVAEPEIRSKLFIFLV